MAASAPASTADADPLIAGDGPAAMMARLLFDLGLLDRFPLLRRLPAAFIGFWARAEHVRSPASLKS